MNYLISLKHEKTENGYEIFSPNVQKLKPKFRITEMFMIIYLRMKKALHEYVRAIIESIHLGEDAGFVQYVRQISQKSL